MFLRALRPVNATGAYVGELVDNWGRTIALRAEVIERNSVKVLEGTGTLTNMPGYDARLERRRIRARCRIRVACRMLRRDRLPVAFTLL